MIRLLDAHSSQVFGRHASDRRQIVASLYEESRVFLHLKVCQPRVDYVRVLKDEEDVIGIVG